MQNRKCLTYTDLLLYSHKSYIYVFLRYLELTDSVHNYIWTGRVHFLFLPAFGDA